jgi:hypothetical protein
MTKKDDAKPSFTTTPIPRSQFRRNSKNQTLEDDSIIIK